METPFWANETRKRQDAILGFCGLYCGGCGIYQATQAGKYLEDSNGNPLVCEGCNSDKTTESAAECDIKACCREQGLRYCLQCEDFPCETMKSFMHDKSLPYHKDIEANMLIMEKLGFDQWLLLMRSRHSCKQCAHAINWFERSCPQCESEP